MSDLSPESRAIVRAINGGWIGRGFMLGIGFWLAGLAIAAAAIAAVITLGLAGSLSRLSEQTAPPAAEATTPGTSPASAPLPPDHRSWQEQLRAQDAAKAEAQRRLKGGR